MTKTLSHNRPGQAIRDRGGWISRPSSHEGGNVFSPSHRPLNRSQWPHRESNPRPSGFSAVPQTNCSTTYPRQLPHTNITRSSRITTTYFAPRSADIEPRTRIRWSYAHERLLFHDARCKSTVKPQWAYSYFATPVTNDFHRRMYQVLRSPIRCDNVNPPSTFDTRQTRRLTVKTILRIVKK